jgi:hypothetical protein
MEKGYLYCIKSLVDGCRLIKGCTVFIISINPLLPDVGIEERLETIEIRKKISTSYTFSLILHQMYISN